MDKNTAEEIVQKTKADYDSMAAEFSQRRNCLPDDILDLRKYIVKGEKVLDLGCGNGRLSELFENEDYLGSDISEALIEIARKRYPEKKFAAIDPFKLPFPDSSFDKVFCLAVIHHIPSRNLRRTFLREARRVLKPEGSLVITAWYLLGEPKYRWALLRMALLKLLGRNRMDLGDVLVPFSNSERKVLANRYFHAFSSIELRRLLGKQGLKIASAGLVERGKYKNIQIVAILAK